MRRNRLWSAALVAALVAASKAATNAALQRGSRLNFPSSFFGWHLCRQTLGRFEDFSNSERFLEDLGRAELQELLGTVLAALATHETAANCRLQPLQSLECLGPIEDRH